MNRYLKMISIQVLLFAGLHSQAQKKEATPEEIAGKMTTWMKNNLGLDESQTAKASEINLRYAQKMVDVKNSSADKNQKMQTLKENEQAKDAELKNVFTAEQFKTYESKKAELKKAAKQKMKEKKSKKSAGS